MKLKALIFTLLFLNTVYGQVKIKMKNENGVNTISCKINGLPLNLIFDTGASDVSLSLTEVSFMLKNGYLKTDDFTGEESYFDANGEVREGLTVNLKIIEIGDIILNNIKATIVKNIKAPLLLGQSALRKLGKIEINFDENTLIIYPNNDVTLPNVNKQDSFKAVIPINFLEHEKNFNIGNDKYEKGEFKEAIEYFDKAINLNNKIPDYYLKRALAKELSGNKSNALADYDKYISYCNDDGIAYGYRGELKYSLGDTLGAIKDLQTSIRYYPKNDYAYIELGKIYFDKKLYLTSISYLDKAIKIDSTDCYNYQLRGSAKYNLKNYEAAITDFTKAIKLCPENPYSITMRGASRIELNDYIRAKLDINKALNFDSTYSLANRYMGAIFRKYDNLDSAIYYYKKATELDTTDLFSEIELAILQWELKERVWIPVYSSDDDELFIKNEIESKEFNIITLWVKANKKIYKKNVNGKMVTFTNVVILQLVQFNCLKKQMRIEKTIVYDSKKNKIDSDEYQYSDFEYYPPESKGEILIQNVCKRY